MLQIILNLDQSLFLFLNSIHSKVMDPIMDFISYNYIPAILILLYFIFKGYQQIGKKIIIGVLFLLVTLGLADSISSKGFKDNFKRLRPMHEPQIMSSVYTGSQGRGGGKYGFVSSHAANTFAFVFFIFLFLGKKDKSFRITFLYAFIVSYSRIYLGKHYPLDLICGALLGILIAFITFKIFRKTILKEA